MYGVDLEHESTKNEREDYGGDPLIYENELKKPPSSLICIRRQLLACWKDTEEFIPFPSACPAIDLG